MNSEIKKASSLKAGFLVERLKLMTDHRVVGTIGKAIAAVQAVALVDLVRDGRMIDTVLRADRKASSAADTGI